MGNDFTSLSSQNSGMPQNCKLFSVLPISSPAEEEHMIEILAKRVKLSMSNYICTVKGYDIVDQPSTRFTCSQDKKLMVYFDTFDYRLSEVSIKNYDRQFNQHQICNLIRCITEALIFMKSIKLHHGDISFENICKKGKGWRLIDKMFIKNGINAYEKVLEGESGFISPKQMIRIRYGFVKESPDLTEADDIFALGMLVLQLASGIPSSLCYKEMNIRFNEDVLNQNMQVCKKKYDKNFNELLASMLTLEQDDRITLSEIKNHPLIRGGNKQEQQLPAFQNFSQTTKLKASNISNMKQNLNYVKSNNALNRNSYEQIKKPLTPVTVTQTSKQLTTTIPNTPRTPPMSSKLSYVGGSNNNVGSKNFYGDNLGGRTSGNVGSKPSSYSITPANLSPFNQSRDSIVFNVRPQGGEHLGQLGHTLPVGYGRGVPNGQVRNTVEFNRIKTIH